MAQKKKTRNCVLKNANKNRLATSEQRVNFFFIFKKKVRPGT